MGIKPVDSHFKITIIIPQLELILVKCFFVIRCQLIKK